MNFSISIAAHTKIEVKWSSYTMFLFYISEVIKENIKRTFIEHAKHYVFNKQKYNFMSSETVMDYYSFDISNKKS